MVRFVFKTMLIIIFIISLPCMVSAVCVHNFECDRSKSNLICYADMTHSYYCLNGCGSYGTVNGGLKAREKCTLYPVYEKEATCTEDGIRIYMCTVCYRSKEESIPEKRHSYVKTRRLPTCTQGGYDLYTCSGCGKTYTDNTVGPISHIPDGGVIEQIPTHDKKGFIRVSCRVCGAFIEGKAVPELNYNGEKVFVPETVRNLKVKAYGSTSVKLVWEKSEYALSYRVYYSTDKKKWKSVSSEKASITVKNLKPARKYYFKVCAVGDGIIGSESRIISAYTSPEAAILRKVTSAEKSAVTVKWKKQNNVSGYEISYSLHKFGKKKGVKKINITKGVNKTLKKLKSGKKYYFRIRAYKRIGSEKIYGAYSKIKTVEIR